MQIGVEIAPTIQYEEADKGTLGFMPHFEPISAPSLGYSSREIVDDVRDRRIQIPVPWRAERRYPALLVLAGAEERHILMSIKHHHGSPFMDDAVHGLIFRLRQCVEIPVHQEPV